MVSVSSAIIEVGGSRFRIKDCGGEGACLFKCLSHSLSIDSHRLTRRQIVSHVIEKWKDYCVWIPIILHVRTVQDYRQLMSSPKTYGSEVEVRAASELYSVSITLVRKLRDGGYYSVDFNSERAGATRIFLLFTGMQNPRDLDGHFQILEVLDHAQTIHVGQVEDSGGNENNHRVEQVESREHTVISHRESILPHQLPPENENSFDTCVAPMDLEQQSISISRELSNLQEPSQSDEESADSERESCVRRSLLENSSCGIKRRKVFTKADKERIVRTRMTLADGSHGIKQIVSLTAKCHGVCESSVVKISREFAETGGILREPKKKSGQLHTIKIDVLRPE
ncbi:hypothetical protein QAD02_012843 [Eretmocerus hayati]|uniref:Uncharacterized protein n=1 Tax=Eretmocerus hayati TaxID=131215 RepID=A0ACC2P1W5_9HYME|nr:hypothetical protein QAD02_012843 [Eretmocerus hayati]